MKSINIFRQSVLSILALSTGRMVCFAGAETKGTRPNFLIIMADDLGYGDLGIFGGYTPTPNLDKLFRSGLVMDNFMVTPLSSPTRASLLTGCNPLRLNQGPFVDGVLNTSMTTFGSAFQKKGYKTGIFGKWHNSVARIFNQSMPDVNDFGFDEWVGGYGGGFDYFTKIWPNNISAPCWYHNRTPISDNRDWPIFRFPMWRRSMGNLVLKTCRTANLPQWMLTTIYGKARMRSVLRSGNCFAMGTTPNCMT